MPTDVAVLFVQDKWHRGDLTLNLGLRYDLEITPLDQRLQPAVQQRRPCGRQEQPRAAASASRGSRRAARRR